MFSKLLEDIGRNPSSLHKFNYYINRLNKRLSFRKWSVILSVLSLILISVANLMIDGKSIRFSEDHIINGINSKQDIVNSIQNDNKITDIYSVFGIKSTDIQNIGNEIETIHSAPENNFWVLVKDTSAVSPTNLLDTDKSINFIKNDQLYNFTKLHNWNDTRYSKSYEAFKGRNSSNGQDFWILKDSGSLVQKGNKIGAQQPIKPELSISKSVYDSNALLDGGRLIDIVYEFKNVKELSVAEKTNITDSLDLKLLDIIELNGFTIGDDGNTSLRIDNLNYSDDLKTTTIKARLKDSSLIDSLCSSAIISASNKSSTSSEVPIIEVSDNDFQCPDVNQNNLTTSQLTPSFISSAFNVTQKAEYKPLISNQVVKAKSGDVIEYKLEIQNSSLERLSNFNIVNNVEDLLDYSDIDIAFLTARGGKYDSKTQSVIWENQTLQPNKTTERFFRIKLKDKIPSTNKPSEVSSNFDCKLSNTFGNITSIHVSCPTIKSYESVPSITYRQAVIYVAIILLFSSLFLLRNQIYVKEGLDIRKITNHKK